MLGRPITTVELIQINKFFAFGRGYKDLIRDFKKCFNIELPKSTAKQFMKTRSWHDIMKYLTGDDIEAADDYIQPLDEKNFELLDKMIEISRKDSIEQDNDLTKFESARYYIPHDVRYFNLPLFGEIITYSFKEPFIKCFLFSQPEKGEKRKLLKIEDIPVSDKLPQFLLRIIRKINSSVVEVVDDINQHVNEPNYNSLTNDISDYENILECELFKKYGFAVVTNNQQ